MAFLWINLRREIIMKKTHTIFPKILTNSNHLLKSGSYGFKISSNLRLTKNQLVLLERSLMIKLKTLSCSIKTCKLWSFIKLNKTLTKLPLESRMGKGKGSVLTEVVFLKKGTIIYTFQNLKRQQVEEIFLLFKKYLPVKLILICKK